MIYEQRNGQMAASQGELEKVHVTGFLILIPLFMVFIEEKRESSLYVSKTKV